MAAPKKITKKRIIFLMLVFCVAFTCLVGRTFYWQVIKGTELRKTAEARQTRDEMITPKRGIIYDRNMKELAVSASVYTVAVEPRLVEDANITAAGLSEILDLDYQEVYDKITKDTSLNLHSPA